MAAPPQVLLTQGDERAAVPGLVGTAWCRSAAHWLDPVAPSRVSGHGATAPASMRGDVDRPRMAERQYRVVSAIWQVHAAIASNEPLLTGQTRPCRPCVVPAPWFRLPVSSRPWRQSQLLGAAVGLCCPTDGRVRNIQIRRDIRTLSWSACRALTGQDVAQRRSSCRSLASL
jgi:hypothetical protein